MTPARTSTVTIPEERLVYIVAAALVLPLTVLLHELGHYISAWTLGFSFYSLSYDSALIGAAPPGASALTQAFPYAAGQLVSLLLVVVATLAACIGARSEKTPFALLPVTLAMIFAEASRSLFILLAHFAFSLWKGRSLLVGFDELSYFVRVFDEPHFLAFALCLIGVAVPIGALIFTLNWLPERTRRDRVLAWLFVGTLIGYAWYFGLAGPLLLS